MDKVIELKFIVPPAIFLLSLFVASPEAFLSFFAGGTIIFGSLIILIGFGYAISSFSYAIVGLLKLHRPNFDRTQNGEFRVYQAFKKEDFIQKRMKRRWDIAMTNFNSFFALVFSILVVLFLNFFMNVKVTYVDFWILLTLLFMGIFLYNFKGAYGDVQVFEKRLVDEHNL